MTITNELKRAIDSAFEETYDIVELSRLYFDIRMECEKMLEQMTTIIVAEMDEKEEDGE